MEVERRPGLNGRVRVRKGPEGLEELEGLEGLLPLPLPALSRRTPLHSPSEDNLEGGTA